MSASTKQSLTRQLVQYGLHFLQLQSHAPVCSTGSNYLGSSKSHLHSRYSMTVLPQRFYRLGPLAIQSWDWLLEVLHNKKNTEDLLEEFYIYLGLTHRSKSLAAPIALKDV